MNGSMYEEHLYCTCIYAKIFTKQPSLDAALAEPKTFASLP
jgi:hypothetical protein